MMREIESLADFIRDIENRKRVLGITEGAILQCRNDGQRRTPEKREHLARIRERARQAGLKPYDAAF